MLLSPPPATPFRPLVSDSRMSETCTEIHKLLFLESPPWEFLQHCLKLSPSLKEWRSKKGKLSILKDSAKEPKGNAPLLAAAGEHLTSTCSPSGVVCPSLVAQLLLLGLWVFFLFFFPFKLSHQATLDLWSSFFILNLNLPYYAHACLLVISSSFELKDYRCK